MSDVLIEALNRVAADPSAWDALIEVLPADGEPLGVLALHHARAAAAVRKLPGEGVDGPAGSSIGWMVLSARGRVISDNGVGLSALSRLAEIDGSHALRWRRQSNALLVAAAVRRALAGGMQIAVRLEQGRGLPSIFALVSPPTLWPVLMRGLASSDLAGAVCLVFPGGDQDDRLSGLLRGSFGLTEAETRLAQRLGDGLSLRQIATELELSQHTVRNHLRAVFDKIGVQRQPDLIRALSQLASLGPALVPAGPTDDPLSDSPPIRLIRLSDGRRLSYRVYGDPGGRWLISMHEGLGSSLPPPGGEALARELGLRVLAPDRPGYGLSDPRAGYGFSTVADDMLELSQRLAIRDAVVFGVATGAIHGLHLAKRLGAGARLALLASPPAPVRRPPADNIFQAMRRRLESQPLAAEAVFAILRARNSPKMGHRMLERLAGASPGDRAALAANPWLAPYISAGLAEAFAVSTRGPMEDLAAFRGELGSPFPEIAAPVEAWSGAEDMIAPAALFVRWSEGAAAVRSVEGVGHLLAPAYWGDLMARARAAWD